MFATLLAAAAISAPPAPFELKDGDRVVWIGNTLVEREQRYGYWETALLAAFPDRNITFRNLGWSGDTVFGDARAGFDNAAKGFERLVNLTLELKPTVIFVSYGTNESFEGEKGLEKFEKGLNKLLDALKPSGARVVLMTPLPFEGAAKDASRSNTQIQRYRDVIEKISKSQGTALADLYRETLPGLTQDTAALRFTDNGMHFNEAGYRRGTLPFLRVLGLEPTTRLDADKLEPLRQAAIAKNQLFFYRWRPQNETYLFGFRKHEQGKNAKEVVEFDPLIAAAEKQIRAELDKLKK